MSTGAWQCHDSYEVQSGLLGISLEFQWKDQGWGNQKGRLDLRLERGAGTASFEVVADHPISSTLVPHEWGTVATTISADALVVSKARKGDRLVLRFMVGGGGGHELHVRSFRASFQPGETTAAPSLEVEEWRPPDINSAIESDGFNDHASRTVKTRLFSLSVSLMWQDQGWGGQKGAVALTLRRGENQDLVLSKQINEAFAPHELASFTHTLDASEPLVMKAQPGDTLCFQFKVGGGGGHELTLKNVLVEITSVA